MKHNVLSLSYFEHFYYQQYSSLPKLNCFYAFQSNKSAKGLYFYYGERDTDEEKKNNNENVTVTNLLLYFPLDRRCHRHFNRTENQIKYK